MANTHSFFGKSARKLTLTPDHFTGGTSIQSGAAFPAINKADKVQTTRLGDKDIARVVKAAVTSAGYDADTFSGHSLRSGFVTSAARAGVADRVIMR